MIILRTLEYRAPARHKHVHLGWLDDRPGVAEWEYDAPLALLFVEFTGTPHEQGLITRTLNRRGWELAKVYT